VRLSWRGVTYVLGSSTAAGYAAEGHLVAFAPLQLRALGLSEAEVGVWSGVLFAVTIATSLPLGPFWGVLAERFSRRAIIVRSWLLLAASLLLAAWAPNLGWLVVSRVLFGLSFGSGAVVASTQALLTPREHVGRAIATVQAAHPIAGSLGPVFGALIIPQFGIAGLFAIDAGLILLSIVVLMLLVPEPSAGPRPRSIVGRAVEMARQAWTNRLIRWNFTAQMLARGATTVVDAYLPVRISQLAAEPASAIGWTLGAYGLLTALVVWAAGALVDRGQGLRAFTLGMVFGAAAALGLALAPWLELVAVLAVLLAIPTALTRLVLLTQLAQAVPREHQTSIFGLFPTSGNVGAMLFPLLASAAATLGTAAALTVAALGYSLTGAAGARLSRLSRSDGAWPPRPPG
jgi:DHA1 family multidrug resistance protein-like MFS transporter